MPHRTGPSETTQRTVMTSGPHRPSPRSACVVVIHGEGLGRRVDIHDAPVMIGRSDEADLVIAHKSVSRRHCEILRDGEHYRLRDLGATNRTRINDAAVAEAILVDGDQLTIGETVLKFISQTSIEAAYHEEIYQLATHDALTDLCNRRHFLELMEKEIARASRHRRPLSLCIIDVDLFKAVNDRHGHLSGDGVLRQIAQLIAELARSEDVAARIGGEEFAILLPECDAQAAAALAERVRAAGEAAEFSPGSPRERTTVSVGIAAHDPRRPQRATLMTDADAALYQAKDEGRNRVRIHDA